MIFGLLVFIGFTIPLLDLIYQARKNQFFEIRFLFNAIYFAEIASLYVIRIISQDECTLCHSNESFFLYAIGYYLFNIGFIIGRRIIRRKPILKYCAIDMASTKIHYVLLFVALSLVSLKMPSILSKISAAGGLDLFLISLYQFRFGTFAEDLEYNALIVLSNMLGGLSLAFIFVLFISGYNKRSVFAKGIFLVLSITFVTLVLFSMFRSALIFLAYSVLGVLYSENKIKIAQVKIGLTLVVFLLMGVNYIHQHLYFATAGHIEKTFTESLSTFKAPHNHIQTLDEIVVTSHSKETLGGKTLGSSFLFFVPRLIWPEKSDVYGTIVIQEWSGQDTHYQKATTIVGELIAHFGYIGLFTIVVFGFVMSYFESFRQGNSFDRAVFYGLLLPRTFPISGMGISALSITLFQLFLYLIIVYFIYNINRLRLKG